MRQIEVHYKCSCMPKEVSFWMQERQPGEDIADFMERMGTAMGVDHIRRSPLCTRTKTEYAKVPMGDDIVGGAIGGTA